MTENEPLTYTLTIQNSGNIPAVAPDNIIVSDTFDPVLTITAVRFNGAVWTSPTNYSYNASTGLFTTAAGQITVPAATYTRDATTGAWNLIPRHQHADHQQNHLNRIRPAFKAEEARTHPPPFPALYLNSLVPSERL